MPVLIVSDRRTGKSQKTEIDPGKMSALIGLRIGQRVDGSLAGLPGTQLEITGGNDKDGFPMRSDVHGGVKKQVFLSNGVGFHAKHNGDRRKRTVRGNMITTETSFLDFVILEKTSTK